MDKNFNKNQRLKEKYIQKNTFYRAEDEECDDGVIQAAGWLGNTGEDGKRVQEVTMREDNK